MRKKRGEENYCVVQKYRVECNRGSKYFTDDERAYGYYEYMIACGFAAELWLVRYYYDESGKLAKGSQFLLESETLN